MNRESILSAEIQLRASQLGVRLFRNTIGYCTCRGRKIRYGVGGKGGSDLIGWYQGRFVAVEVKVNTPTTKEQVTFLKNVIRAGGIGIIAHSVEEFQVEFSVDATRFDNR